MREDAAEVERLATEVLAIELERSQARIRLMSAYLDKVDPFWRNKVDGYFEE